MHIQDCQYICFVGGLSCLILWMYIVHGDIVHLRYWSAFALMGNMEYYYFDILSKVVLVYHIEQMYWGLD